MAVKVIVGDRQTGKTQKIIDWYIEKPESRVILTATADAAVDLKKEIFYSHGVKTHSVYPVSKGLRSLLYGTAPDTEFAIDNADLVLQALLLNLDIDLVTINAKESIILRSFNDNLSEE